jgi:hypothetical protein
MHAPPQFITFCGGWFCIKKTAASVQLSKKSNAESFLLRYGHNVGFLMFAPASGFAFVSLFSKLSLATCVLA